MRFSSNPLRINSSYEELFDFSSLNALTVLDIDFSFNDIQAEYLPTLLRQISQNSKL